jgi:hypothetical protein
MASYIADNIEYKNIKINKLYSKICFIGLLKNKNAKRKLFQFIIINTILKPGFIYLKY